MKFKEFRASPDKRKKVPRGLSEFCELFLILPSVVF